MSLWTKHAIFEKNSIVLLIGILVVIAIGGLVEIAPLFYLKNTIEKVEGVRPYTPLELAGRNIYVREGCYICHSQMIRAVARRGRALRPLLARGREHVRPSVPVGLEAHRTRSRPRRRQVFRRLASRASARPALGGAGLDHAGLSLAARRPSSTTRTSTTTCRCRPTLGVPYTRRDDRQRQGRPAQRRRPTDAPDADDLAKRYPKAQARDFDGNPQRITEMDALVAYLQMLGTLVDFKLYDDKANIR